MLTVFCPPSELATWETYGTLNGERKKIEYRPRPHRGRMVLDIPRRFFTDVMLSGNTGRLWQEENHEVMAWLGRNDHNVEVNDAFPGADRPPPVTPTVTVTDIAPVFVKLRAPAGATRYSHGGAEHAIGKDGTITVDEHVAEILKSHGFIAA